MTEQDLEEQHHHGFLELENLLQFKLRNDGPEWLSDFTKAAQPIVRRAGSDA